MAAFGVYGAGLVMFNIHSLTSRQSLVSDETLGRVNATYRTAIFTTIPIGALAAGWSGTHFGLRPTLLVSALALVAGCVLFALWSASRVRTWLQAPGQEGRPA
jgi:predicted MFS family arabinose efflux permease